MLISYEAALERILAGIEPLPIEHQPVENCAGRVLASSLTAQIDIPPFNNSAMDGYAVRAEDTTGANEEYPVHLGLIGEVQAGSASDELRVDSGQAARIFTGGKVPSGADAIVPVEDTVAALQGAVAVAAPAEPGAYLRRQGEEMRRGEIALAGGTVLRAYETAQAASLGAGKLPVHRAPRVALIATGNELVEPGTDTPAPLAPGQIYNSNVYALHALVQETGGVVVARLHALDTPESVRAALRAAEDSQPDVILSSGGVSVGDYDFVKAAVEEDGRGEIDFWRVAIRPGKPFVFGRRAGALFFGLPGNPVSTIVTYELFARPALRRLLGHPAERCARPLHVCTLTAPARHEPGRRSFQRAIAGIDRAGQLVAQPVLKQGSHMVGGLVQANSLIVVPENVAEIAAGAQTQVMLLSEPAALGYM